jgi:hypothetical protein
MKNEYKEGLVLGARVGLLLVALGGVGFVAYSIYRESTFAQIEWDSTLIRGSVATGLVISGVIMGHLLFVMCYGLWVLLNWLNKGK